MNYLVPFVRVKPDLTEKKHPLHLLALIGYDFDCDA